MPAIILQDSRPVATVEDSNAAFAWLLRHQGQSVDYALRYGGYEVVEVPGVRVILDGLTLCACCAIACANDDVSGCEDGQGHEPHALSEVGAAGVLVVGDHLDFVRDVECYGCAQDITGEAFSASVLSH